MIEYSTENLESCLRKELKNPEEIKSLLQESDEVFEKRKSTLEKIEVQNLFLVKVEFTFHLF